MLECLIMGDSIAQGIASVRTECVSYAHIGWTSGRVNDHYRMTNLDAETVIISLGTNDHKYIDTLKELTQLRGRVHAKKVIWILPAAVNPKSGTNIGIIQASIAAVSNTYADRIITIPHPMADRYHPTARGYKQIAKETK